MLELIDRWRCCCAATNTTLSAGAPRAATRPINEMGSFTESKSHSVEIRGRAGNGGQFKSSFDSSHLKIGLRS